MSRLVIIFASLLLIFGCKSTPEMAKVDKPKSGSYDNANERAKLAQEQLECEMRGDCPAETAKPIVTGDKNYDRANEAADKAHAELDCEIRGDCPIPEKVKPVEETVTDKDNPNKIKDAALDKTTKYPIVEGYPVWFFDPYYDGYLGGVGIAKKQKGGYSAQKRVGISLAQADLVRSISILVDTETTSEKTVIETKTMSHYNNKFSISSKHTASEYLSGSKVMDEWLDEKTGELFVWVVIPK